MHVKQLASLQNVWSTVSLSYGSDMDDKNYTVTMN